MGFVEIDEKKFRDAEETFRKLFQSGRDDIAAATGLSEVLVQQGRRLAALDFLKTEVARHPGSVKLRQLLAGLAIQTGDDRLATEQIAVLLSNGIKTEQIYRSLAEVQFRKGELDSSVASLRLASTLAPDRPDSLVLLASVAERAGKSDEARAMYRRALQMDPQNVIAMNNLAYNLAENRGNLDEALQLAMRATQLSRNPEFVDTMGWVYLRKNMPANAVQIFRGIVEKYPENAGFRIHLGMALLARGDRNAAKEQFTTALATKPSPDEVARIRALITQAGT
jgi:Flp pilus assembly protein TadD